MTIGDNTIVTVVLPVGLVKKMIGPWYLVKREDSDAVRAAMRRSVSWIPEPSAKSALQESPSQEHP